MQIAKDLYNEIEEERIYSINDANEINNQIKIQRSVSCNNQTQNHFSQLNLNNSESDISQFNEQFLTQNRDCSNTIIDRQTPNCLNKLNKCLNCFGKLLPKSKIKLPLTFKGIEYYTSRRVTFLSVVIISFIVLNSYLSIIKIGQINTLLSQEVNFQYNNELADYYHNIMLKPIDMEIRLPFYMLKQGTDKIECSKYKLLSNKEKLKYGKAMFQVFDITWEGDFIFVPFDCFQTDILIYFYINNDFGNWYFKLLDYEYASKKKVEFQDIDLTKYNLPQGIVKVGKEFHYQSSFYQLCQQNNLKELKIQLKQSYSYINTQFKMGQPDENLFIYRNQSIGKDTSRQNICDGRMWLQELMLEKKIITKPLSLIKSILWVLSLYKQDIYYDYVYDQLDPRNSFNSNITQSFDDVKIQDIFVATPIENITEKMISVNIDTFDLKKVLSQIGGFISLIMGLYGLFLNKYFSFLFQRSISKFFIEKDKQDFNLDQISNCKNRVYIRKDDRKEIKEMKKQLTGIFSYEKIYELNKNCEFLMNQDYNRQIQELKNENNNLKDQINEIKENYDKKFKEQELILMQIKSQLQKLK